MSNNEIKNWEPDYLEDAPIVEATDVRGTDYLNLTKSIIIGSGVNAFYANSQGIYLGSQQFATAPFSVSMAGAVVATSLTLTGGTIKYGKTSFTDSTHAGYFIGSAGIYFGSASDATKLKYDISAGTFDFVGTISGRSSATIASVISSTAQIITSNLDTSAKTILGEFTFSGSGALAMNTDANNGLWISPTGILGKKAGVNTFTIGIDGTATFAGTLAALGGTFGMITGGNITLDTSGYIRGGATDYLTGTGFFLGYSGGAYKSSIGTTTNYLAFDGASTLFTQPKLVSFLTAGEDIASGDAVSYDLEDQKIYRSYGDNPFNCFGFIGIAAETITSGNVGKVYLPGSVIAHSSTTGSYQTLNTGHTTYSAGDTNVGLTKAYGVNFVAARFYISDLTYITGLNVTLTRVLNCGAVTVSIVKDDGSGNKPADMTVGANILNSETFAQAFIGTSDTTLYCRIPRMIKATTTTVWIVVSAPSGDVNNYISWYYGTKTAMETECLSGDSGATWGGLTAANDHIFNIDYLTTQAVGGLDVGLGATAVNNKIVGKQITGTTMMILQSPNVYMFDFPLGLPATAVADYKIYIGFMPTKITFDARKTFVQTYFSHGVLHTIKNCMVELSNTTSDATLLPNLSILANGTISNLNTATIKVDELGKNYFRIDIDANAVPDTGVFIVEG